VGFSFASNRLRNGAEEAMETWDIAGQYEALEPQDIIAKVLSENGGSPCITCSFQAEGVIVLDFLRRMVPDVPVLFIDTGYHFAETYSYRDRLAKRWNLNLVNVIPAQTVHQQEAELGLLYRTDPTSCCYRRKVEPLMKALEPFDIWFTGMRREQSPTRTNLKTVEYHKLPSGHQLLKVHPLAGWDTNRVWNYLAEHEIEYLPLYDDGYPSIGCEPCTSRPVEGAGPRSGRWGGTRQECGIHTISTQVE
jgi:phosphoadenosine phosphosulfate reductase